MDKKGINRLRKYIRDNKEINANGCWIWQRLVAHDGYGIVDWECGPYPIYDTLLQHGQKRMAAHRMSWLAYNTTDMEFDKNNPIITHKCNNRVCCNPLHIKAGTHQTNMEDAVRSGAYRDKSKFLCKPERLAEIQRRLLLNQSMYSIAKLFSMTITSVRNVRKFMRKRGEI